MTQIKPLIEDEEYAREYARYSHIRTTTSGIMERLRDISLELAKVAAARLDHNLDSAVADILAGNAPEDRPDGFTELSAERERLTRRQRAYNLARIQQKGKLDQLREARSGDIARAMQAGHQKVVDRLLSAVDALEMAVDEERAYREQLSAAGYDDVLPSMMPPRDLGNILARSRSHRLELVVWKGHAKDYCG
ncbi:hypothetical protein EIK56_23085 [Sphingomonas sp. C8-2]|nr:hypothetical protein EIK56_23085 [Sphingomonas sp. C8-2]